MKNATKLETDEQTSLKNGKICQKWRKNDEINWKLSNKLDTDEQNSLKNGKICQKWRKNDNLKNKESFIY